MSEKNKQQSNIESREKEGEQKNTNESNFWKDLNLKQKEVTPWDGIEPEEKIPHPPSNETEGEYARDIIVTPHDKEWVRQTNPTHNKPLKDVDRFVEDN